MDCLEQPKGHDRPHTGSGAQAIDGMDSVWLGALDDMECQVRQQTVRIRNERQVASLLLWTAGSAKRSAPRTVRLGGDLLAHLGQRVGAVGMLDMGQACGPLAPQVDATAAASHSEPTFPSGSRPPWSAEEEASIIIIALQLTVFSLRSCVAAASGSR